MTSTPARFTELLASPSNAPATHTKTVTAYATEMMAMNEGVYRILDRVTTAESNHVDPKLVRVSLNIYEQLRKEDPSGRLMPRVVGASLHLPEYDLPIFADSSLDEDEIVVEGIRHTTSPMERSRRHRLMAARLDYLRGVDPFEHIPGLVTDNEEADDG